MILLMKTQTTLLALKRQNLKISKTGLKSLRVVSNTKKARERAKVFLIRVNKPSLNDQYDHKAFKLF